MRKRRSDVTLGLLTLLVAGGFCAFVFSGTFHKVFAERGTAVEAQFDSTSRLAKGMPVRVGGVVVGRVSDLTLDGDSRTTTAELTLFDEALPLYRDARADLRWRTALGANYAIELDRGTKAAGELSGMRIAADRTTTQVEVDEILAGFRKPERGGLETMLEELPAALADERQPAAALSALSDTSPSLARGLRAARGVRPGDLTRLVHNTSATVSALAARPDRVADVVEGGGGTTAVTAKRAGEIRQAIATSAGVLPRVDATLARLRRTLDIADPVVSGLDEAAPSVAPTVARLRPTLTDAELLLRDAAPVVRRLRPAATALARAARAGRPLIDELVPILRRLEDPILADLAKRDKVSGRPTYQMIGPAVAALTAASAGFDSTGHVVALTPGADERSIDTLPCKTYFGQPNSPELITCQDLNELLQKPPLSGRSKP